MSTKILLTDGSGSVKGSVFYDSAADEIRIASHDSNSPSHIDGYIAVSSAGLSVNGGGSITSGVWTPTLTAVSNVASSMAFECTYSRVNGIVHIAGYFQVTPTSAGVWRVTFTLPIASDFTNNRGGSGVGVTRAYDACYIWADATADELEMFGNAPSTATQTIHFNAQYQVIA